MIHPILTDAAPIPSGHYTQAIAYGDLIFVAGQLPLDAKKGVVPRGSIEEQTERVLDNVQAILAQAGSDLNHVLKATVYISDIELWGRVNQVYARRFGAHKPARAVVPVGPLHYGYQIEIEVIAVRRAEASA
jgi:2-iminobutanoate/2-iminopropanoate deaminase